MKSLVRTCSRVFVVVGVVGAAATAAGQSPDSDRQVLHYVIKDAPTRGVNTNFEGRVNVPKPCLMRLAVGHYMDGKELPSSKVLVMDLRRLRSTVVVSMPGASQSWARNLDLMCADANACVSTCQGTFLNCYVNPESETFKPDRSSVTLWAWSQSHADKLVADLTAEIKRCGGK